MGCGDISFLEGGTISKSTVVSSDIINSDVSGSTLSGCELENLTDCDEKSAQTILDAIVGQLDSSSLKALAEALMPYMTLTVETAEAPSTTEASDLATTVYGDRGDLMGKPGSWLAIGGKKVPAYD